MLIRTLRFLRRTAVALANLLLVLAIVALVWLRQTASAETDARFAFDADDAVSVTRDSWIAFRPRDIDPKIGLIFYPGGKADPAAYAPILHQLAARGFLVVMTPMPLNIALLAPNRAERVMTRYPEIHRWVVAGHSLGGVAAADFAAHHVQDLAGLVLWASYPTPFNDLSGSGLPVLSISGSLDALATPAKIVGARRLLPAATQYVEIAGGDHWNFGNFAPGRSTATVTRDRQQQAVLEAVGRFLQSLVPAHTDSDEE